MQTSGTTHRSEPTHLKLMRARSDAALLNWYSDRLRTLAWLEEKQAKELAYIEEIRHELDLRGIDYHVI